MNWLKKLLTGSAQPKIRFRAVDWHSVEARILTIKQAANSSDQAQKKQSIIQFDMLLDDILKQSGAPGNSMGERMRAVGAMLSKRTNDQFWQAHKKRNELVHESGSFVADWEIQQHLLAFERAAGEMRGKP